MPEREESLSSADALKQDLYLWLQTMTLALVTLILLFTFVGRIVGVEGSSMEPTLRDGDMLLLQSIAYTPSQGDIVVLTKPFGHVDGAIVKRVIAVGGQHVDIDYEAGTVSVDGVPLDEPYIKEAMVEPPAGTYETITSVTVPEGSVFVMGDNRNNSDDSRDTRLGTVDEQYILGRAVAVLLPLGRTQMLNES